jgi:hypothetical protein
MNALQSSIFSTLQDKKIYFINIKDASIRSAKDKIKEKVRDHGRARRLIKVVFAKLAATPLLLPHPISHLQVFIDQRRFSIDLHKLESDMKAQHQRNNFKLSS